MLGVTVMSHTSVMSIIIFSHDVYHYYYYYYHYYYYHHHYYHYHYYYCLVFTWMISAPALVTPDATVPMPTSLTSLTETPAEGLI